MRKANYHFPTNPTTPHATLDHLGPRSFVPLHDDNTKIWIKFIYGFWVFVKDKIGEHFGQNWKGLRETYGWMDLFMQVGWGGLISTFYPQCISFSFTLFPFPFLHTLFLYTKDNLFFSFSLKIWCLIACFWIVFWNNLWKMSGLKMADVALRQLLGSWNIWEGKKRKKKNRFKLYIFLIYIKNKEKI